MASLKRPLPVESAAPRWYKKASLSSRRSLPCLSESVDETMDQISSEAAFSSVEFAENPEPRVPCVLIVDTSTSMQGPRIDELNKGLQSYKQELLNDPLA